MKRTRLVSALLGLLLLSGSLVYLSSVGAQTSPPDISGRFYRFRTMATESGLTVAPWPEVSINDRGVVAFTTANNVYTADGLSAPRALVSSNFNFTYNSGVQINNNNLLIARKGSIATGSAQLLRFDLNPATPTSTVVADTTNFSKLFRLGLSMNNATTPQHAFFAHPLAAGPEVLATGFQPTFNTVSVDSTANADTFVRPAIADNGNVVIRAGYSSASPIRIYSYSLGTVEDIAPIGPTAFSTLGRTPGSFPSFPFFRIFF